MKIIFLDTEVTGLNNEDKVCQIAFLVLDTNTKKSEMYETLCNPMIEIKPDATECHGITNEMVSHLDNFTKTAQYELLKTLNTKENVLVAHNAQFDIKMLARDGFIWDGKVIDTLKVSRILYNDSPKFLIG